MALLRRFAAAVLVVAMLGVLAPFAWMLVTALTRETALYNLDHWFTRSDLTMQNFTHLFRATAMFAWLWNSTILAVCGSTLSIVVSFPAAYAVARIDSIHPRFFAKSVIAAYGLPPTAVALPVFFVASRLGIEGSPLLVVVMYGAMTCPVAVWLLTQYINQVPRSIDESARLDGAGTLRLLGTVILPAVAHGVAITFAFAFLLAWGEYSYALMLLDPAWRTVPVGLAQLEGGDVYSWGMIMAGSLVACLPALLVVVVTQSVANLFHRGRPA